MMDYEWEIEQLRKQSDHLREMQKLGSARHDTADARATITESLLRENSRQLVALTATVNTLAGKVDALVSALLREHPNGKEG